MTKKEESPTNNKEPSELEKDLKNIGDNIGGIFEGLGDSFSAITDNDNKVVGILSGLLRSGTSAVKATWGLGSTAVKNIPKVIVVVAETKRVIVDGVVEGIEEIQKENKEKKLEEEYENLIENIKSKQKLVVKENSISPSGDSSKETVEGYLQDKMGKSEDKTQVKKYEHVNKSVEETLESVSEAAGKSLALLMKEES